MSDATMHRANIFLMGEGLDYDARKIHCKTYAKFLEGELARLRERIEALHSKGADPMFDNGIVLALEIIDGESK